MTLPRYDAERPSAASLAGRTVLITGATGGLGRSLALACAASGATLILHARVVRKLESLYDEIVAGGYAEPTLLPLDFSSATADEFGNVAAAVRGQFGRLDGLIHTAAILGSLGPLEHQSFDAWIAIWRVNVAAAMALTRAMLPLLAAASDASVVFTLDTRGEDPRAFWGGYAAAKAGLSALAKTFADECEQREQLRVNAVVPGAIRSPLRMATHPGEDRAALPSPEALAPLYLHLLAGQTKHDSGVRIDAQAWLAGQAASTSLLSSGATGRP